MSSVLSIFSVGDTSLSEVPCPKEGTVCSERLISLMRCRRVGQSEKTSKWRAVSTYVATQHTHLPFIIYSGTLRLIIHQVNLLCESSEV